MSYTPIEDYGVIGNLETVPLIGRDGAKRIWRKLSLAGFSRADTDGQCFVYTREPTA